MNVLKLILFTLIIPGFVAGWAPYILYEAEAVFDLGNIRYIGWLVMLIGAILYIWSSLSFLLQGEGTPAIWFTKRLHFILGEEPVNLVSSGLYKFSRNPMYLGVISFVFGIGIWSQSKYILIYAVALVLIFHLVVVFLEEPHLKKKYGKEFTEYLERTRRWF